MADKPNLLVIGGAMSPPMRAALEQDFTLHALFDQDDQQAWLAAHGTDMPSVLTDGHWGVRPGDATSDIAQNDFLLRCWV